MQEQTTLVKPKIHAQKKHVIIFAIACALLAIGIITYVGGVIGYAAYMLDEMKGIDIDQAEVPGMAAAVLILAMLSIIALPYVMALVCTAFWVPGAILSGIVTFSKKPKPGWLNGISCAVFCVHAVFSSVGIFLFLTSVAAKIMG